MIDAAYTAFPQMTHVYASTSMSSASSLLISLLLAATTIADYAFQLLHPTPPSFFSTFRGRVPLTSRLLYPSFSATDRRSYLNFAKSRLVVS